MHILWTIMYQPAERFLALGIIESRLDEHGVEVAQVFMLFDVMMHTYVFSYGNLCRTLIQVQHGEDGWPWRSWTRGTGGFPQVARMQPHVRAVWDRRHSSITHSIQSL
jgi:hypothetical protein